MPGESDVRLGAHKSMVRWWICIETPVFFLFEMPLFEVEKQNLSSQVLYFFKKMFWSMLS